jgi:pimeloyl-ACP methyl ester carboxylesterase
MAREEEFATLSVHRHHIIISFIVASVMLLPIYHIPQLAWSQSQEPAPDNAYMSAGTEHVQVGDINIAYKRFGEGKPILFIAGTSQTKDAWEPTVLSELAATNHTVIVFDNRGMGETPIGTKPFSIEQFANDTAGLLDALQIERADRLVLHAGYCGGNETVFPTGKALENIMTLSSPEILRNMTAEEQAMILAEIMFPPEWLQEHPEVLNTTVIQLAPSISATPEIIQQQGLASATWKGACDRLSSIMQPTLVIAGDQDLLAPAVNSIMMAQRIPNSWLVIIQGTGHGMMFQVPMEFSAILQTFLETTE